MLCAAITTPMPTIRLAAKADSFQGNISPIGARDFNDAGQVKRFDVLRRQPSANPNAVSAPSSAGPSRQITRVFISDGNCSC